MEEKLKACPFCGGEAELVEHLRSNDTPINPPAWTATCIACEHGSVYRGSDKAAIAMWNRRADSPEVAAPINLTEEDWSRMGPQARATWNALRKILARCHEALGEHEGSDDETVPKGIAGLREAVNVVNRRLERDEGEIATLRARLAEVVEAAQRVVDEFRWDGCLYIEPVVDALSSILAASGEGPGMSGKIELLGLTEARRLYKHELRNRYNTLVTRCEQAERDLDAAKGLLKAHRLETDTLIGLRNEQIEALKRAREAWFDAAVAMNPVDIRAFRRKAIEADEAARKLGAIG